MSSPLAIAAVSYVLRDLLNKELVDQNVSGGILGDVTATALPPDRVDLSAIGQGQLNLYMYRVSFNQGWREVDQPSFNDRGERISNPPLAIDLHYLLTSYGVNELHTEILLGYGMHFLHKTPGLDRKAIRGSFNTATQTENPVEIRALPTSELADQIELIKIVPENMSTEEISKIWTAFGSKYRPSVAYLVTVLLIESKESTKTALRVRKHNVYVDPFHQPVIEKIYSRKAAGEPLEEDQPILPGYDIIISGHNLKSDQVKVSIGGIEVPTLKENITDNQIEIQLPALPAGINGVQVIHDKMMGSPPEPRHGTESNIAAFVLCPVIDKIEKINGPSLKITVTPAIEYNQRAILLLNEFSPGKANEKPLSYSLKALVLPEDQQSSNEIVIPVSGVKAGDYLVRIKVDGAESQLSTDANGKYVLPRVSLP